MKTTFSSDFACEYQLLEVYFLPKAQMRETEQST